MKIAIATDDNWTRVSGHAGQTGNWLVFDCLPDQPIPEPERIHLDQRQLPHNRSHDYRGDSPHPLRGVEFVVAANAGDGFFLHMAKWGAQVLLTGETDPRHSLEKILFGAALADARFDITSALCKLQDLFSSPWNASRQ